MPGMRPDRSGPVCAVTACRTRTSRVGGFGFSARGASDAAASPDLLGSSLSVRVPVSRSDMSAQRTGRHPVRSPGMTDVHLSPTGPPETVLDPEPADAQEALRAALALVDGRRDAVADVCARWPRYLDAWAQLGRLGRDDVEAYAYFRVGYHRGLDKLRQSGWRGSGYVKWEHETNRGFLRALDGLRSSAEAIGEADEAQRCAEFLYQLDPEGIP